LGIIRADFDVTDQLLVTFIFHFYMVKKCEYNGRVHNFLELQESQLIIYVGIRIIELSHWIL
jgi:hypothetical protein